MDPGWGPEFPTGASPPHCPLPAGAADRTVRVDVVLTHAEIRPF